MIVGRRVGSRLLVALGATVVLVAGLLVSPVGAELPPVGDWARHWGDTSADYGYGVAVDGSGNVYVTGYFSGTVDFDPGPGTVNLTSGCPVSRI